MIRPPSRYRKLYAGPNIDALLQDFYPDDTIEVNGESFYKNELAAIARTLEMKPDKFTQVEAFVTREPENEFDPNAVAVYIHEKKVGYVNKLEAPMVSAGLKSLGSAAWVMAGIKEVTEIGQYRVRLMAHKPISFDPRVFEFLDLSDQSGWIIEDTEDATYKNFADLYWRQEQIATDDYLMFSGPFTVLLNTANSPTGGDAVAVNWRGQTIKLLEASEYPDIFDAVLEVNQFAWAAINLMQTRDDDDIHVFFSKEEGTPSISSYAPKPQDDNI
ncbi:MAG: hypothetical protein RL389_332 [Actinomycetota bacterium]|jgi:hypothetical protein